MINIGFYKDWILDRRHCNRDWSKNVLPIRTKINLAIQDMPENEEIKSLLSGSSKANKFSQINYITQTILLKRFITLIV